jgi:hypothetical protein
MPDFSDSTRVSVESQTVLSSIQVCSDTNESAVCPSLSYLRLAFSTVSALARPLLVWENPTVECRRRPIWHRNRIQNT